MNQPDKSCYTFGEFRLDGAERRLLRNGAAISLAPKVFDTLLLLVQNSGHLVEKDEFMRQIWADTFVGEDALARNISILRKALGGSSDSQAYIETIPTRGYRFAANVQNLDGQERAGAAKEDFMVAESSRQANTTPHSPPIKGHDTERPPVLGGFAGAVISSQHRADHRSFWRLALTAFVLSAGSLAGLVTFFLLAPAPIPKVMRVVQLSHSARFDPWGKIITDGTRLFYLQRNGDHWNSMRMPISGGESQPLPVPFRNTRILDISPDKTEFLIAPFTQRSSNLPLWTMPVVGGTPRRIGNILVDDAVFSPDGTRIAYFAQDAIYTCTRTGTEIRKIASPLGNHWDLSWSPDGKVLRLKIDDPKSLGTSALWEVSSDGHDSHPLLPGWNASGGAWSPEGRNFFFMACREEACGIWARREKRWSPYFSKPSQPVLLAQDPAGFSFIAHGTDGRRLYAAIGRLQFELLQQDQRLKEFRTRLNGDEIRQFDYSRKGDRIAAVSSNGNLWQSRPDGSNRVQLTTEFSEVIDVRWSPDGTRIAFDAKKRGRTFNIYEVRAEGGAIEELLPEDVVHVYPDWSPDGRSIVYSTGLDKNVSPPADGAIYVLNLQTRETTKVPGSDGLQYPRWSPDGKYLAARSEDSDKMMLFDFFTHHWKEMARGHLLSGLTWSADAKFLYFEDILAPQEPVYRMRLSDSEPQRWIDFDSVLRTGVGRCQFIGLAPDGSALAIASKGSSEIYALDLDLP